MSLPPDVPPDDVLDAALRTAAAPSGTALAPVDSSAAMVALVAPIAQQLTEALARVELVDIVRSTPADRAELVALRKQLDVVRRDAAAVVDAIDMAFREAARQTGAKQISLGDEGIVRIEQRGEWIVNVDQMRNALDELVGLGLVTEAERDAVFTEKVTRSADNRKLNYLAENRGEDVRAKIDEHRQYLVNPQSAKLTYARG